MKQRLTIPDRTRSKLDEFRKRVWKIKIIEGLCAAAFGLLLSYLLVFVIDRFIDTPQWLRATLLVAGATGLGILFPLKWHRWVWRTRRFDQLARLLKHRMPRLSDRMLGIIELAENDVEQQRSAALCEAALRQVDDDIKDVSFNDAVPHPKHRAWAWAAGVPLAIAALALVVVPAAGLNALKRWVAPWSATERYTFAQVDTLPERLFVPYSEDFTLQAKISDESAWTPQQAVARIGKQPPVEVQLQQETYNFNLPPQKEDGVVQLSIGDARKSIPVEPKLRPELTGLLADIQLPSYLQYDASVQKDARGGTLSVVKGSVATLRPKTSRRLKFASLNGASQEVEGEWIRANPVTLQNDGTLELSWRDEFDLSGKQPFKLSIQAHDDMPPTIVCSQLRRQQVVMVDQVLTFEVNADDDFGVKEIGIQWTGLEDPLTNPNPAKGEALIMGGKPADATLKAQATFCPSREGIPPQTLQVRLYSVDYFPTRERVYSPPYTLFVLTQQDHANWLTEQLRRWSRQAQQVYERENQLYEENKALRALPKEELGKKDTRDRIESQAAAESANARQLTAVSNAGKQLIKEATKNDQFNVMTMEGLAEMVKTLDELSKSRMPSVADLLKSAAAAPDSSSESDDKSEEQGESGNQPKPPTVGNNRDPNNKSGKQDGEESKEQSKPKPSISDIESSMNQKDEDEDQQAGKKKEDQPPGEGKFSLPSTTVLGGGPKPDNQPEEGVEEESIEEELDKAIEEQENLLEEFTKIAEELQRILDNLEGSTFVKRLKAASRRQLEVADDLNASLAEKFGKRPAQLQVKANESTVEVAEREQAESQNLGTIKTDLEAYYSRVQQGKFRTVIVEMNKLQVASGLDQVSSLVTDNLHGQSIAHAEYWADTFDRWAEQLVGPG